MHIFLAGATGFIGGHLLRALLGRGHAVTCLVRSATRLPRHPGVRAIAGEWTAPEGWVGAVTGHEAVVNAAGIIRETPTATFTAVHTAAPLALFTAAARAGVCKVVQVSALGVDEGAVSRFHRSKRAADRGLAALGVPYVVLRPSLVHGPGDHSMDFFNRLVALPLTPVPGDGRFLVQPIHVADLARAVATALERDELVGATIDAGGGEALTFDAMLDALARRRGKREARKLHIPWAVMEIVARVTDVLGRGPITGEELGMLRRGNHADLAPFVAAFGFRPRGLEEGLTER
jgi:uncharacterized protein YbjT (DUF2867 family)